MTEREAIRVINRNSLLDARNKEHREAVGIALDALKFGDNTVRKAIIKIAIELEGNVSCTQRTCPCFDKCNSEKRCYEWLAEWMEGIVTR